MSPALSFSLFDTYLKVIVTTNPISTRIPGTLLMYSCGPTVYGYQSIGNMRAAFLPDLVAKVATVTGWNVRWALNITDVGHLVGDGDMGEDKISKTARANQQSVAQIVEYYTADYQAQCKALRITLPTGLQNPKASEYIQEQMLLTLQLVRDKLAYFSEDGIYFDYQKFVKKFGKTSSKTLQTILERDTRSMGDRNFTDRTIESSARHPYDFAVWKFVDPDSLQSWKFQDFALIVELFNQIYPTPHTNLLKTPGCPGWHSECVAMIVGTLLQNNQRTAILPDFYTQLQTVKPVIDLHFGGEDHIDIHHKNEILQSSALGFELSKAWVHNKFVMVDGQKMSKSLGNVYQVIGDIGVTHIPSIQEAGFDPLSYRVMLFEHNYTEQLNFTWEKLVSSESRLIALRKLASAVSSLARHNSIHIITPKWETSELLKPLLENLNSAKFLELYGQALQIVLDQKNSSELLTQLYSELIQLDQSILQLDLFPELSSSLLQLLQTRLEAKNQKEYLQADALRHKIQDLGYLCDDYQWGSGVRLATTSELRKL